MAVATLYVDRRVGSKDLVAPLAALGLPVEADVELAFGDLSLVGRGAQDSPITIGIEFKKLEECVAAMRSERLQGHQAPGLAAMYEWRYLLVEGTPLWNAKGMLLQRTVNGGFRPLHGHMTVSEYYKRLETLGVQYGLLLRETTNRRETLRRIEALYRFWTDKSLDAHRSAVAVYRPPSLAPVTNFVRIVASLPGVGYELARRCEAAFHTPMAFLTATDTALLAVEGIGPQKLKAIRACLG